MFALRLANTTVPAGNVVANTSAETILADSYPLPDNFDGGANQGRRWDFTFFAALSTKASAPGTLTIRAKLGATTLGTSIITLAGGLSNVQLLAFIKAIFATTGTSGKVACQGMIFVEGAYPVGMVNPGSGTTGQVSANTRSLANITLSAQFSVADPGNSISFNLNLLDELQ